MDATTRAETPAPVSSPRASARRKRRKLARDLTLLGLIGVLLLAGLAAGFAAISRELYSPTAFVERYLSLLADGRAADALALPGVGVGSTALSAAGLPKDSSDALLRTAALSSLTDIERVNERTVGDIVEVTMSYRAGGQPGKTTFRVEQNGWIGVAPTWRFTRSPLAAISVSVTGSQTFEVNDFLLDRRQVSPLGAELDPVAPVSMLVFSPGLYQLDIDTPLATTEPVAVLADAPLTNVNLDLEAEATEAFSEAVQSEVNAFLDSCAQQQVLNPTGCPFGFTVRNRIDSLPTWSIVQYPEIALVPNGANWGAGRTDALAHLEVDIRFLFDGRVVELSEDVPFSIGAEVTVQSDGAASIRVLALDPLPEL